MKQAEADGKRKPYQGGLLWLWGAWRAIGGGGTALIAGVGHVPICQGFKRRQSVLVHRDTVQGFCEHCQQVGLIFFIYLLRKWQRKRLRKKEQREKIEQFSSEKSISALLCARMTTVGRGATLLLLVEYGGLFFFFCCSVVWKSVHRNFFQLQIALAT